jgi:hypothetical protein
MFPLSDENPTTLSPLITFAVIAACTAVWVFLQGAGMSEETFYSSICNLGVIPAELTGSFNMSAQQGPCPTGGLGGLFAGLGLVFLFRKTKPATPWM